MNGWLQKSDFSATDVSFVSSTDAIEYWGSLDFKALDEQMDILESERGEGGEFCPWGLGMGWDTDSFLHIFREDRVVDTFSVLAVVSKPVRLLGFISRKKKVEKTHETVPKSDIPSYIKRFFDGDETLVS